MSISHSTSHAAYGHRAPSDHALPDAEALSQHSIKEMGILFISLIGAVVLIVWHKLAQTPTVVPAPDVDWSEPTAADCMALSHAALLRDSEQDDHVWAAFYAQLKAEGKLGTISDDELKNR